MHDSPMLLTAEAAAERLSVGRTTIWALIATGALASVKINRSRRVPATALEDYVRRLSTPDDGA